MIEEWIGYIQKRADGSEVVNYNSPYFPTYINYSTVSPSATWINDPHFHDDIEIVTVTDGYMGFCVNGEEILLNEGDTLFVNSDIIHYSMSKRTERTTCVLFIFHPGILCSSNAVESKFITPVIKNPGIPFIHFTPDTEAGRKMQRDVMKITEYSSNEFQITHQCFEIWENVLNSCREILAEETNTYPNSQVEALKKMLNFIQKDYMNPITLEEIASAGNVSRTFCNNLFKKYTNQTPIENLTRFRVGKVADYLKDTSLSMAEIASKTGFAGSSYMSETFRKYFGESPRDYKKREGLKCHPGTGVE